MVKLHNLQARLTAPFVLLEDRLSEDGESVLLDRPADIIRADRAEELPAAFQKIERALDSGQFLAGYCSFELGYAFEPRLQPLMPRDPRSPLLWFGCFKTVYRFDPASLDVFWGEQAVPPPLTDLVFGWDAAHHAEKVRQVLDFLRAGDVYQINLTFPLHFRFEGDPLTLYAAMRAAQPVAHGGIVATGAEWLLSASPELFVETQARRATTKPMKGTTARGTDPTSDTQAARTLQNDPKQRAENLMIVDLLRNDLSRISTIGTVEVPQLFTVETYPTLHTLTSTVNSQLKPNVGPLDLIRAMFPCGSVTGAPKIRAMEIIRELEIQPRGVYTGAMGMILPNRDLKFNVAIRTATLLADGNGIYGVGGGIVADSTAAAEYAECQLKARVLTDLAEDFGLIETLRWSAPNGFMRLDLHLERLARSANLLGFPFDESLIRLQLETRARSFESKADQRVRVEIRRSGTVALTCSALAPDPERPINLIVASERIDSGNPILRHKTTKRRQFEVAFIEAQAKGADDALFLNRHGFVTETTRGCIFVAERDKLLTPALRHGLLPGILRRELIESGRAYEADLRLDDVLNGVRCFVGSSLTGLREAVFAD